MQLISNGPDIPERLLQAHEEGRVVFFCGAGISYPAGLPGFKGLVTRVRNKLGVEFRPPAATAFKSGQFDSVLGLLESEVGNGREVVRRHVADILTPNLALPRATATHEALLTLSRTRDQRQRLITTNFDRLFEKARSAQRAPIQTYAAPLLPVPKHRWDGIVYLHGLLPVQPTPSDLDRLVLTSGDFGLAYLTERWAARFVGELLRTTAVCFVGYSINDPVLRYMMDALAADRLLGESPPEMFAFGSYKKTANGREIAAAEWQAKNVTPILYREYKRHHYLHKLLREWAKMYDDGVLGPESIISRYAASKPAGSTREDDYVGRLLWALSHKSGLPAKRFAKFDPLPSLDWLEPMAAPRYGHADLGQFGITANHSPDENLTFSLIDRLQPYTNSARMRLVGHDGQLEGDLDAAMHWLAHWLSRHADDPALLLWVADRGSRLHSKFARDIEWALETLDVRPAMVRLWRIVLMGRLHDLTQHFNLYGWVEQLKSVGYSVRFRLEFLNMLTPQIQFSRSMLLADKVKQQDGNLPDRIRDLVDWDIVLRAENTRDALQQLDQHPAWRKVLAESLSDLTSLLRDILDLDHELDGAYDYSDFSYIVQPSIEPHEQNKSFNDWTLLIDLVRDAWSEVAQGSPDLARAEIQRWLSLPYPLFRRLALFAAKNREIYPPALGLQLLLDDPRWLWSVQTQREAVRLIVTIAPDLDEGDAERLQDVILAGPDREMFRDPDRDEPTDAEDERISRAIDRDVWLRLIRIRDTGAQLTDTAATRLAEIEQRHPQWQPLGGDLDDFAVRTGDGGDWGTLKRAPSDLQELIAWLREHPDAGRFDSDNWRELCQTMPLRATRALFALGRQDICPAGRWRTALHVWSEPASLSRSWQRLSVMIAHARDKFLKDANYAVSRWLQAQAKTFERRETEFLTLVSRMVQLHREDEVETDADIISEAINHPIGQVVQALFDWWYRQGLTDDQGLSADVEPTLRDVSDTGSVSYRYGRVFFGVNLIALYRVDRDWTKQHVLPLLDWNCSIEEAAAIWKGFLWAPRLYRPLFVEIKTEFLETAQRGDVLGDHEEQYAGILSYAGLEAAELFDQSEMRHALASMSDKGLREAAQTLLDALEGAAEQRSAYWGNRIKPFIERHWPRGAGRQTAAISELFARICVASSSSFPEAFDTLRDWLLASQRHYILPKTLAESGQCRDHPETALALLDLVIATQQQWLPSELPECLEQIGQAQPGLSSDYRYRRLDQLARSG